MEYLYVHTCKWEVTSARNAQLGCKLGKKSVVNLDVKVDHEWVTGNQKSKLIHELGNLFWFLDERFRWKLGNLDTCLDFFCCIHTALQVSLYKEPYW